jgi:hypothetical protein
VFAFSTLAVIGSNCPNGNLSNVGVKPENLERETARGSVPHVVILHALPETKGADQLINDLENMIQIRRSYKMPKGTPPPPDNLIWLQFGTGTKWNSQL